MTHPVQFKYNRPSAETGRLWLRELYKLPVLLLFPLAYMLEELYRTDRLNFRFFYDQLYPKLSRGVNWIFSPFRYSVAEFLIIAGLIGLIVWLAATVIRIVRKNNKLYTAVSFITSLLCVGSLLYFIFIFFWGINYARPGVAQQLQLTLKERPKEELTALCADLAEDARALRLQIHEDENGVFCYNKDVLTVLEEVPLAYRGLRQHQSTFSAEYGRVKAVRLSRGMNKTQIAGIFIPHTMEANVNIAAHPLLLASTACHEQAHLYGYAREDEANFVAYLACIHSEDPEFRYSGTMLALIHSMNQLYSAHRENFNEIHGLYSEGMLRDLQDYNAFWAQYEGKAAEVSNDVNHQYLVSRGQEDGVKSYGRMVDLLLAYAEKVNGGENQ